MKLVSIDKKLESAVASIEMEGFHVRNEYKEWCMQYMRNEITMEEYMHRLKELVGVTS